MMELRGKPADEACRSVERHEKRTCYGIARLVFTAAFACRAGKNRSKYVFFYDNMQKHVEMHVSV